MITNADFLAAWEALEQAEDRLSYKQKRRLMEGMYLLARKFGRFTEQDMLEGLEATIAMATYMRTNVRSRVEAGRPRT